MYNLVTRCRACGFGQPTNPGGIKSAPSQDRLVSVLNLGVQPLANDFRKDGEPRAGFAPLEVLFCPRCTLAQLSVVVDPGILYRNYSYVTSPSKTMREHFDALVGDILTETKAGAAVEIGSNDGLLMSYLSQQGFGNLIGIDPACNLADRANKCGVTTINDFFNKESATTARDMCGKVDLVIARHVFCHVDDWRGFIDALDVMSRGETLVCIEVPWVHDQLMMDSFDVIYHEHLSYLSLKAMKALLAESPFHLHRVLHYPVHGGALLMMLRKNCSTLPPHPSVFHHLDIEKAALEDWQRFASINGAKIEQLQMLVKGLRAKGKRVCGFGASAKSTVWINACGFTKKDLYGVYDCTLEKQFCLIPGTDIPILHEGAFYADAADYALLFAWNYANEVIAKHEPWAQGGGKWILPVPTLKVIDRCEGHQ